MRRRLVLIEDNPIDIKNVSDLIQQVCPSCRLQVYRDGVNALDFFHRYLRHDHDPVTLVLLDLKIPFLNGIDLLRQMKSAAVTRVIPVVAFTGTANPADIEELYRIGVNGVVAKTHDPVQGLELLRATLDYWLNNNITVASKSASDLS